MDSSEVYDHLNPLEGFVIQIIEKEFGNFSKSCGQRFTDSRGDVKCRLTESNCEPGCCPKLKGMSKGGESG